MKTVIIALSLLAPLSIQAKNQKVLYGQDDRYEVENYGDSLFREKAQSVAGMVQKYKLYKSGDGQSYSFNQYMTLENTLLTCPNERFSEQVSLPICTGFLVAPDVLVTAGHCVAAQNSCRNNAWVFGYTEGKTQISAKDIYNCKEIISQRQTLGIFAHKDYAVIKLDRVVTNRAPLKYRTKGNIKKGESVVVIGHPSGLPLKIADNAVAMTSAWNTFRTNLDTYSGNSGSPVFNQDTGLVEGILIQGAEDYERSASGCAVSAVRDNVRSDSKERVFKIRKVKGL